MEATIRSISTRAIQNPILRYSNSRDRTARMRQNNALPPFKRNDLSLSVAMSKTYQLPSSSSASMSMLTTSPTRSRISQRIRMRRSSKDCSVTPTFASYPTYSQCRRQGRENTASTSPTNCSTLWRDSFSRVQMYLRRARTGWSAIGRR